MSSEPTLTRRRLLGGGAAVATGGAAAYALAGPPSSPALAPSPWEPPTDAWPQARYGVRNTARNPNAAIPAEGVTQRWTARALGAPTGIVAQRRHLAAFGPAGLIVLDRDSGEAVHTDHVPAERAAFGPPGDGDGAVLYAAGILGHADDGERTAVRAWEIGERARQRFFTVQRNLGRSAVDHLLAGDGRLYLGGRGEGRTMTAVDARSGDTVWRAPGGRLALLEDDLLVTRRHDVTRYGARSGLDALVNDGPYHRWETTTARTRTTPAISDDTAVVGLGSGSGGESGLLGLSTADGERHWEPVETIGGAVSVAVDGETALAANYVYQDMGDVAVPTHGWLHAVGLADASRDWSRETEWVPLSVAADGAGRVVVAGGHLTGRYHPAPPDPDRRGVVRCHDVATGERRWRYRTPTPVETVALVGETVYAGCADGTVRALG